MDAIITGGRYKILARLGSGGMSQVYLAEDMRIHVRRAIKRIPSGDGSKSYIADSVISEANVLRKVRHPALPRIVDIFREEGCVNLVMEYIEGKTLEQVIAAGPPDEKRLIDIALEICSALKCLHSMKPPVIYRDLKPSNIMVRSDGHIALIDFGTAKRFYINKKKKDTTLLGTYGYAAPEQFMGRSDERSDIYSLGMTLRECIGEKGTKRRQIKISKDLKKILDKCTQEDAKNRYKNIGEVLSQLYFLRHRNTRLALLSAASVMAMLTLGGVMYGINAGEASRRVMAETLSGADIYTRYIESGNEAYFIGDYALAEKNYTSAIVEADPTRDIAYLQLLKLYRRLNLSAEGLERMDILLDGNEYLSDTDELYYECALTAFYDCADYARAEQYLGKTDFSNIHEAQYIYELSELMSSLDTDIAATDSCLKRFEEYNAALPAGLNKLKNNINISTLLLTYCEELDEYDKNSEPLYRAEKLMREALEITMEDIQTDGEEYRIKELGMLSTIYRMLGNKFSAKKDMYYTQAIDYTIQLLGERSAYENEGEVRLKLLYMARMYEELEEYKKALECYERSEELYPYEGADIYTGHLRCLLKTGAGKEELEKVYKEALKVKGIAGNSEFRRLQKEI